MACINFLDCELIEPLRYIEKHVHFTSMHRRILPYWKLQSDNMLEIYCASSQNVNNDTIHNILQ